VHGNSLDPNALRQGLVRPLDEAASRAGPGHDRCSPVDDHRQPLDRAVGSDVAMLVDRVHVSCGPPRIGPPGYRDQYPLQLLLRRSSPVRPLPRSVVPKARFELARPCGQRSLSPPRLPVPPLRPGDSLPRPGAGQRALPVGGPGACNDLDRSASHHRRVIAVDRPPPVAVRSTRRGMAEGVIDDAEDEAGCPRG
jgi:hypothetical protein